MAVDHQTIAEIVRLRLNLASGVDVIWSIPEALERLGRKIAANPRKRSLLLTDETADYALSSGAVDLTTVTGALREYLHLGEIWHEDPDGYRYDYPLQPLKNTAFKNAPKTFGNNYYHYFIEGDLLKVRNFDINQPDDVEGNLFFSVPRRPTIADVDAHPELVELLVEKVIEIMTAPQADSAEDGEN